MENQNFENEIESGESDVEDLTAETENDSELVKKLRNQLKQQSGTRQDLAKEIQDIKRENTLAKAGLELTDIQRRALEAAHGDSEFSVDKVKETAAALGFIQNPDLNMSDDQAQSLNNIADASQGSDSVGSAQDEFQKALVSAKSQDEIMALLEKSGWADQTISRWNR